VYGLTAGLDYEAFVGLSLNVDRVRARRVLDLVDALKVADGRAEIPAAWYRLLTDTEEEAVAWRSRDLLAKVVGRIRG